MNKEILVDANGFSTRVAVVENGEPVEIYVEQEGASRLVGNIYYGKVQNVLPGMQAAFIDIGLEKNAFLYAGDVITSEDEDFDSAPQDRNISDLLKKGQNIIVQVAKDPIGTKGARVTTHITLAGRSVVLMPTMDFVGVSHRVETEEERNRLRKILTALKPEGMGLIARTASVGKTKEAFAEDVESLTKLYREIEKRMKNRKAPCLLFEEQSLLFRTVRDFLMKDVDRLFVNDEKTYEELKELCDFMAPKLKPRILLKQSEALFNRYDVEGQIDRALQRKVWLKSGGYLIIDRTEALTVIDVNTGKFVGKDDLEKTITETNCEAAVEIAHQLRLRDVGGIIVVDFIDMEQDSSRSKVLNTLRNALKEDHTRTHAFGFTHLGLVELTRKKTGINLCDTLETICPYCDGTAHTLSPETVMGKIRRQSVQVVKGCNSKNIYVDVHPDVAKAMERAQKDHSRIFPEELDAIYYIHSNPELHIEKFVIRPLSDKHLGEAKRECLVVR